MNDNPTVEDLLTLFTVLYDIDIVDGNIIRELARRSLQSYGNTVRLLNKNNLICYVNNINAFFHFFRCPNCDTFFNRTFNLQQHLTTCSERVKNVCPKSVYQTQVSLFDKLDCLGIEYTNEQTLFKNLAIFDFEWFVCKMKASKTLIQQNGLESIIPSWFPSHQILWKSQFFFATLILIFPLLLSSVLLKI